MSADTAYIVGKGGHARVIAALLPHARIRHLVEADAGPEDILQSDFLGGRLEAGADHFIGIGDNGIRRIWFDRLKSLGLAVSTCIAPTAWVAPDAVLGEGLFVGPGAVVNAKARIGDGVIINTLASVDHDSEIGADTQLTPGVNLGSHLVVGRACYFGMKSCVLPRLTLGDRVTVMAGALVVRSAPDGVMLGGSPARVLRAG